MKITMFTDGGSRGNPGAAAAGVVVVAPTETKEFGFYLGDHVTNNQAEYLALLLGVRVLKDLYKGFDLDISVVMDSELIIKQMKGEYSVKDKNLAVLYRKVSAEITDFSVVQFSHTERSGNADADRLVNLVLDAKHGIS